tara:strand:+ start:6725 stop:7999 length:1275 start_codon:yes stop_codon:yes gene_type:complete
MEDEKPINPKAPEVINPFAEAFKDFFEPSNETPAAEQTPTKTKTEDDSVGRKQQQDEMFKGREGRKEEEAPGEDDIEKLLAQRPEELKTKAGQPVTESSRQSFRNLQKALEKKHKELEELKKQILEKPATQEVKLDEIEEYKKLLEEKDRYKKEVDLFAFENSDEWKQTFEAPIEQRRNRVNEIISNLDLDEDDAKSASILIRKAQEYLGDSKKEIAYSQVIDRLAQDYIKSPTAGKKFTDAMVDLFELTVKRAEAKGDRDKARTEIRGKYEKQTQSSIKTLQERLDMELIAFEKSDLGQIFKSVKAKDFDYDASSKANKEKALQAIKDFQVTGQVTQELAEMARHFSLKPALEKEREFFLKTNIQLSDGVNKLLKENEDLKKRILELRGEGGSQETATKKSPNSKENYDPRNVFQGLEKVLAS